MNHKGAVVMAAFLRSGFSVWDPTTSPNHPVISPD